MQTRLSLRVEFTDVAAAWVHTTASLLTMDCKKNSIFSLLLGETQCTDSLGVEKASLESKIRAF